ncbi:hypothetical protein DFP73DRAFT_527358 [Morchella snyderi]|nr:hypothetical protein DFP73DRAFT_527358 [Morchella snyderi]
MITSLRFDVAHITAGLYIGTRPPFPCLPASTRAVHSGAWRQQQKKKKGFYIVPLQARERHTHAVLIMTTQGHSTDGPQQQQQAASSHRALSEPSPPFCLFVGCTLPTRANTICCNRGDWGALVLYTSLSILYTTHYTHATARLLAPVCPRRVERQGGAARRVHTLPPANEQRPTTSDQREMAKEQRTWPHSIRQNRGVAQATD